jgi:aspartate/methionine/tyrosine aminotransferase
MKPTVSVKAKQFKRNPSPVHQIMSFADPAYIRGLGVDPDEMISFAGGWVNHTAPEGLREAYEEISRDGSLFHKSGAYPHTQGTLEFKEAVVAFEQHLYGKADLDVGQLSVGLGSTQVGMALFEVLLDPGDKVLFLDPTYCNYPTQLVSIIPDVKILRFPVLDEETWTYDPDGRIDEFQRVVREERPKVILLISPDNPSSQVLSDAFVEAAVEVASEIGSFVVMDHAYKEMVFSETNPKYFSWGPRDNYISLRSNSKWCRSLGRRLGWVEAPTAVVECLESIQNSAILCPDMLHEMAMARYVARAVAEGTLVPYLSEMKRLYKTAADRTIDAIESELGYPTLEPLGGLFTCMKVGKDGGQFVKDVLQNAGVLFVPGWGFGRTVQRAVRVSFGPLVNDLGRIDDGFERVGRYLAANKDPESDRPMTAVV